MPAADGSHLYGASPARFGVALWYKKFSQRRVRLRAAHLVTVSILSMTAAQMARAEAYLCPGISGVSQQSCSIPDGGGYTSAFVNNPNNTVDHATYAADNHAEMTAPLNPDFGYGALYVSSPIVPTTAFYAMLNFYLYSRSYDESTLDGIDGADVTLNNYGNLTLSGQQGSLINGLALSAIDVQGAGGGGATANNLLGLSEGGRGGDGGVIEVINQGDITIDGWTGDHLSLQVAGILAHGDAGNGGAADTVAGNQAGGNGGDAKQVTVENHGAITIGTNSNPFNARNGAAGIEAIGQGGLGGTASGEGGTGAVVSVTNTAPIRMRINFTDAADAGAQGIHARSKGGNGSAANDNSFQGGNGEDAKSVTVTNSADIIVHALVPSGIDLPGTSAAILAESLGGQGGTSPNANAGGVGGSASVDENLQPSVSTVTVEGDAAVRTVGAGIMGIVARSEAGNGGDGNGSFNDSSVGGNGGVGGDIELYLDDTATVTTTGTSAYGIAAQSLGGTGGANAGTSGRGGAAGDVRLATDAGTFVRTFGDQSAAVTLHSLGGGGGFGDNFTRLLAGGGGNGGNGGDGGKVEINAAGGVETWGEHSSGLLVQSIGGSGGTGGVGTAGIKGLGGDGEAGGDAGQVIVNNTGGVSTDGYHAPGILAQSIGGGGGFASLPAGTISVGGYAGDGSDGNEAYVTNGGDISTNGNAAIGINVQSIGGGGGSAAGAVGLFAVGGTAGAGGNGGAARAFHLDGTVATQGVFSHGIVAHSIGRGGGNGGDIIELDPNFTGIAVGGTSANGGNGSEACVANTYDGCDYVDADGNPQSGAPSDSANEVPAAGVSSISTSGNFSVGAMAQSIGGGGGNGGNAKGGGQNSFARVQIGGGGSGGGDGGIVTMGFDALTVNTRGNHAPGLLAQSVGGGGGNGGNASSMTSGVTYPLQVGGSAHAGGQGQTVTIEADNSVVKTMGSRASGIVAHSVGGGGGSGGMSAGYSDDEGLAFNLAVGGAGGAGGKGEDVAVTLDATEISTGFDGGNSRITLATDAHGITAQSIGGGGGMGGTSIADAYSTLDPDGGGIPIGSVLATATVSVAVGGAGGASGGAGNVDVTLSGESSVTTGADGSFGILAQSIAHGGGDAGGASSFAGTVKNDRTNAADISVSLGNQGGAGGNTGDVTVGLQDVSQVITHGHHAPGLAAQSIGGGGGTGGIGSAFSGALDSGYKLTASIGLGGAGGSGGTSGSVHVTTDPGTLVGSFGAGSRGILAQSVGGGGGTAMGGTVGLSDNEVPPDSLPQGGDLPFSAEVTIAVGSNPGAGTIAGDVHVDASGEIFTGGGGADGILAHSVGGSGGLAGSVGNGAGVTDAGGGNPSGFSGGDEDTEYRLTHLVGGTGGTGGDADEVTVKLRETGLITTMGDWADGIVAQSIGGGGGVGGTSTAAGSAATAALTIGVGGQGGAGGAGGDVTAILDGSSGSVARVSTGGYMAHAVLLQSIGGGGGQGGDGSDKATGSLTIGGGAGGEGGASGNGGAVSLADGSMLHLSTLGDKSYGFVAQSVGGGGGIGGAGSTSASGDDDSHALNIAVGGTGGSSGNGGTVTLTGITAQISTSGDQSFGLVAQSIGGGGGIGGGATGRDSIASLRIGGSGGGGGDADAVNLSLESGTDIQTPGDGAYAIVAQSIGGGGGIAGDTGRGAVGGNLSSVAGTAGTGGSGGSVSVEVDGTILASGDASAGILAQSIGGGGGLAGLSGQTFAGSASQSTSAHDTPGAGMSGDVTIVQHGSLSAGGAGSMGIFAQSQAPDTQGAVSVEINGDVAGGSGFDGTGVYIIGGGGAELQGNDLTVQAGASLGGYGGGYSVRYTGLRAISDGHYLVVENYGDIYGDMVFESAINDVGVPGTVYNQDSGTLYGVSITGANVVNDGTVVSANPNPPTPSAASPSASSLSAAAPDPGFGQTRITGAFTQSATGMILADVDLASGRSSPLVIDGDARLDGRIGLATRSLKRGVEVSALEVLGNVTGSLEARDTPTVDFDVRRSGNSFNVSATGSRYADAFQGLSDTQTSLGAALDSLFDNGSEPYAALLGGLSEMSAAEDGRAQYAAALSDLSLGSTHAAAAIQAELATGRLNSLFECRSEGVHATSRPDGSCAWIGVSGSRFSLSGDGGFDGSLWGLSGGAQMVFNSNWTLGLSLGFEDASYDGNRGRSSSEGTSYFGGLSLGYTMDALSITGGVSGSFGNYDTTRRIDMADFSGTASGDSDVTTLGARVRTAYRFETGKSYVKPFVDLDVVSIKAGGYTETGAGRYNLAVEDENETAFMVTPAVEFGTTTMLSGGVSARFFATFGVTLSSLDSWSTEARFADAGAGASGFDTSLPVADTVGRVTLGAAFWKGESFDARIEYNGAFGDDLSSHSGAIKLIRRF